MKGDPAILGKFFQEVERRDMEATFGVPVPILVLARENVLSQHKRRRRTPSLKRAYRHLEGAWEILADAEPNELSQALEELMERLQTVTSQAAKGWED